MTESTGRLLQSLPAIFEENDFFGDFLKAFEKILIGRPPEKDIVFPFKGLEETIASIASFLDPQETPEKFLSWLSDWTAFTLRADLEPAQKKEFLANILQLYRRRGTKANLQNLLKIFTPMGNAVITETDVSEFQIGVHSRVGVDTYLNGGTPHYFRVTISLPQITLEMQTKQAEIAYALIELEKPAHTYYTLNIEHPSMRIGRHSTVGVDTLLGIAIVENEEKGSQ